MSFHLVHNKNGVEVPITISVLDAFRSTPTRPAKKTATTFSRSSNKKSKATTNKSQIRNNSNNASFSIIATKDKGPSPSYSAHSQESYTDEDDIRLVALKSEVNDQGASVHNWKEILKALGKQSENQLKKHYREIAPSSDAEKKEWAEKYVKLQKSGEKRDGNDNGKAKAQAGGGKGPEQGKNGGDAEKKTGGGNDSTGGKDKKRGGKGNAHTTKPASAEEKVRDNLRAFVAKYERDVWLAAASRHYDLTGQRISPERAKALSQGK